MILDMLRDQFETEQYQVITAKSGEEALQKLMDITTQNLRSFLAGAGENIVNR